MVLKLQQQKIRRFAEKRNFCEAASSVMIFYFIPPKRVQAGNFIIIGHSRLCDIGASMVSESKEAVVKK